MSSRGLIAFAGVDGAGKSTQCAALRSHLAGHGISASVLDRWAILDPEIHPECRFIQSSLPTLQACIGEMDGWGRALFLFWATALTATKALEDGKVDVVLADGYWIKHAAAELVYGCPESVIQACAASFPQPSLVLHLDLSPELALARKQSQGLNAYECGRGGTTAGGFLRQQGRIREVLTRWSKRYGWVTVDASQAAEVVQAEVRGILETRVLRPGDG